MKPGVLFSQLVGGTPSEHFDPKGLTNRFDRPFAISAIHFTALENSPLALDLVAMRLWAGGTELTRGYTPLACLAPVIDRTAWGGLADPATSMPAARIYAWEFAKPLVLPPNTAIGAMASTQDFNALFGASVVTYNVPSMEVTLIGMVLDERWNNKKLQPIPYASAWQSGLFLADAGGVTQVSLAAVSPSSVFANPYNAPLYVKNMICSNVGGALGAGGAGSALADGIVGGIGANAGLNAQSVGWHRSPAYQFTRSGLLGEDVKGTNYVTRDFCGSRGLFYLPTREWRMNAALGPKEYLQARAQGWLSTRSPVGLPGGASASQWFQHRIGMTGYRVVPGNTIWH